MVVNFLQKLDEWAQRRSEDPHFLWKLFLVALALRVGLVLLNPTINLISDMLGYHESAISLLESGEFRVKGRLSATRPPLYSVFIHIIYYLFGTGNLLAVRLVQCVLGAFTAVLTYKLTEKVFFVKAAVWAGLLFAIYPASIGYCDLILSEALFTFLFIAGLYYLVNLPSGGVRDAFFAALLLGFATLTRTILFIFPIFITVVYLVLYRKRLVSVAKFTVFILTFWMVLVPWLARNERVFDKPILTTKSGVDFFLYNHNPFGYILLNYCLEGSEVLDGAVGWQLTEIERDEICREAGIEWIKEHPFLFLFKGVRMQWNYFGVEREYIWSLIGGYWGYLPKWMIAISFLVFAPTIYILMPLFIWGVVYSWGKFPKLKNLLWIMFYFLAVTFVYFGFARHRAPLNSVMMAFAGYALASYKDILGDLKLPGILRRPQAIIAFSILAFFVVGWLLEIFIDAGSLLNLGFTHEVWKNIDVSQ